MSSRFDIAQALIAKLATRAALDGEDALAIHTLSATQRELPAQSYLIREGERPSHCAFLLSGLAFRHKIAVNGGRQIVAILVPGDFIDLQQLFLRLSDHNVQAMTAIVVAELSSEALRTLARDRPNVARAMWIDTLLEASIGRELALNIGRRDAITRVGHLLCEFHVRLMQTGQTDRGYELPMTQEQIGDATGLTSVHVNRTLKELVREGLVVRDRRFVRIVDWNALARRSDFNPLYLHLDQAIGTA